MHTSDTSSVALNTEFYIAVLPQEERRASTTPRRKSSGASDDRMTPFLFPASAAGHIAEIRWASFSFMMRQLADELGERRVQVQG